MISAALRERTSDAWVEQFQGARVPIAKVRRISEVCADPQMETRTIVTDAPVPGAGDGETMPVIGAAFTTNTDGPAVRGASPSVGEHNDDVLRMLGYSAAEIEKLDLA